ncbi:MAG: hypothetical protein VX083_08300 [Pseudomonadota bacterium]|jgi:hypothetical protein|nr:hypothetical protein [Pseudomonadota bacterium]MEC8293485.1 hypothetical protein [Pseudomonadota bacterium]
MAYSFSGFFIKEKQVDPSLCHRGHVSREITDPFLGCGILTPNMDVSFGECAKYLNGLGVSDCDWIFLNYETWAGSVDYFMAFGIRAGRKFGPIEGDGDSAEVAFFEALDAFGLEEGAGYAFAPFERDFWEGA